MNSMSFTTKILLGCLLCSPVSAYEVWMGLHGTPAQAGQAPNLATWDKTAAGIQGINGAQTAVVPVAGTSTAGYTSPSDAQYKTVVDAIANNDNAILEFSRDALGDVGDPVDIPGAVDKKLEAATTRGFVLTRLMLHGSPNQNNWSLSNIESLRAELDAREAANPSMPHIELGYLVRGSGPATEQILLSEAIDFMALEISADLWNTSGASRLASLQWFWNNPTLPAGSGKKLSDKQVFFQIFASADSTSYGAATAYQSTRLLIRQIGQEVGSGFLASDRVILSPTTNGNPSYVPFYPEAVGRNGIPDGTYGNTKTGIALSLLEQKSYFEAPSGPTESRCRSAVRLVSP